MSDQEIKDAKLADFKEEKPAEDKKEEKIVEGKPAEPKKDEKSEEKKEQKPEEKKEEKPKIEPKNEHKPDQGKINEDHLKQAEDLFHEGKLEEAAKPVKSLSEGQKFEDVVNLVVHHQHAGFKRFAFNLISKFKKK